MLALNSMLQRWKNSSPTRGAQMSFPDSASSDVVWVCCWSFSWCKGFPWVSGFHHSIKPNIFIYGMYFFSGQRIMPKATHIVKDHATRSLTCTTPFVCDAMQVNSRVSPRREHVELIQLGWWGEQGWRSGESTRLPPAAPGFDSWTRHQLWVEFVVGSRPHSERFFSGYSGSPLSSKTNISKFQFDLDTVDEEPPSGCATAAAAATSHLVMWSRVRERHQAWSADRKQMG